MNLSSLKDTTRRRKASKRIGRGVGSGKGKTCGRGTKGAKARSGYKRRYGNEGGQCPVFSKIPIRGFSRGRHKEDRFAINLELVEKYYKESEIVNRQSLIEKKFFSAHRKPKLKILGNGELKKALTFEVDKVSAKAKAKIEASKGSIKLLGE